MAALFFPVLRSEAKESPQSALTKLRNGGITWFLSEKEGGYRCPFYRQEVPPFALKELIADCEAAGSFLYWNLIDFVECPARERVPERYFRRYFNLDGTTFFVGTVGRSAITGSSI